MPAPVSTGGFFGRGAELALLDTALAGAVAERTPRGVIVLGAAGLGKTRLVQTFLSRLIERGQPFHLLRAASSPHLEAPPYGLLRDLLASRFRLTPCDSAEAAREKVLRGVESVLGLPGVETAHWIGHLAGCDFSTSPYLRGRLADPNRARQMAFQALAVYFNALAASAPLVLWCDGLQWADDATLGWLDALLQDRAVGPLLVIGAAREPLSEAMAQPAVLSLPPLANQDCLRMARALLESAQARNAPTLLVRKIERLAGGNPEMIEELVDRLLEDGPTALDNAPAELETAVLERIQRLPAGERQTLRHAAVIGPVFWDAALQGMSPEPEAGVAPLLESLVARGLVEPRDEAAIAGAAEYAFRQMLYVEKACESLEPEEQRAAHARAAAWLSALPADRVKGFLAAIASHYERAGEPLLASQWYARAAARAREGIAAPGPATPYYRRALDLLPDAPEHLERRVQIFMELWDMQWWQACYPDAQATAEELLRCAEKYQALPVQATAWNCLAAAQNRLGDYPAALRSVQHAERLARQVTPHAAATREVALALFNRGLALYSLGIGTSPSLTEAREASEQALALNQRLKEPGLNEAESAWRSEANADTTSAAAAAGAVPTTAGSSPETARILTLLGLIHQRAGRYDQAEGDYLQVLEAHRRWNDPSGMIEALNNLGSNAYLKGDMAMAAEFYEAAVGLVRELGSHELELACLTGMAGAQVELGKFPQAETALRGVVRQAPPAWPDLPEAYRFLALAYAGQRRYSEALNAALQSLELAGQRRSAEQKGRAWRALGSIAASFSGTLMIDGQPCTAHTCYAASLQIFVELGATGEQARTARSWARYELEQGDPREGARLWQEARDLFARLGLPLEVQRMDQLAPERLAAAPDNTLAVPAKALAEAPDNTLAAPDNALAEKQPPANGTTALNGHGKPPRS